VQDGRSPQDRPFGREDLEGLMDEVVGGEGQAQRLASLTDGVDGVLPAASLGVRASGQGVAVAQGLAPRHAITPVDRWRSHPKRSRAQVFGGGVPCVVGERRESVVNCAGTAFAEADQGTVVLGRHTEAGRRTPLVCKTVTGSELKAPRHDPEDDLLVGWAAAVPKNGRVTGVADRGCSASQLESCLTEALGLDDSSRVRGVVDVAEAAGERRQAQEWLGTAGRRRVCRHARVTAPRQLVPVVVCVRDKAMQAPWWLGSRRQALTGVELQVASGRRVTVEETCTDVKNPRVGLGRKPAVIARHDRRDALCLRAVRAHTWRTWLGQAGQERGMDRRLGARRPGQLSRFRQGRRRVERLPKMRAARLRALAKQFADLLQAHARFTGIRGIM
jgi:hypothetical protein